MTSEVRERATSKASRRHRSRPEGSVQKLAQGFLAELNRSWRQNGPETLARSVSSTDQGGGKRAGTRR